MATGSKPPPAPDPYRTASAEGASNVQTALGNSVLSNPNVVGPTGSTTYTQSGEYQTIQLPDGTTTQVPRYTQTNKLSEEQQRLYDLNTQTQESIGRIGLDQSRRIGDLLGRPMDLSGLPDLTNDFSADRARVEQSLRDRLAPVNQRNLDAERNRLTNMGFQQGTEAWKAAMDDYNRGINDQNLAITGHGLAEQQGMYGMASNRRNQAFQEMLQQRNQPINEITALLSGSQVSMPNAPGYNAPQIQGTNIGSNIYNSAALANQQWQQEQQSKNAMMGGLFGLAGTAAFGGMRYGMNPMAWGNTGR